MKAPKNWFILLLVAAALVVLGANTFLYDCPADKSLSLATAKFDWLAGTGKYSNLKLVDEVDAYVIKDCGATSRQLTGCENTEACLSVAFLNKHTCVDPETSVPLLSHAIALITPSYYFDLLMGRTAIPTQNMSVYSTASNTGWAVTPVQSVPTQAAPKPIPTIEFAPWPTLEELTATPAQSQPQTTSAQAAAQPLVIAPISPELQPSSMNIFQVVLPAGNGSFYSIPLSKDYLSQSEASQTPYSVEQYELTCIGKNVVKAQS